MTDTFDVDQWDDRVNVSSRLPKHLQLRDILLDHVRDDGYRPGSKLPTEASLVRRFNVARSTARRALDALVIDGYATHVPGTDRLILLRLPPSLAPPDTLPGKTGP